VTFRALVFESEALVAERVRQMLAAEGFSSCLVDAIAMFHELAVRVAFDLFVVGVKSPDSLGALGLSSSTQPLVLLAPLDGRSDLTCYRLELPDSLILDRGLRDPDALRRAIGKPDPWQEQSDDGVDAVGHAFATFGLSDRQLQVLGRALVGETSRKIADSLFISELTVRNHLHAIYERVGVSGRRELLGRFVRGLIEGNA
jgi:DNA-binding CsgD family transcriptional regulator